MNELIAVRSTQYRKDTSKSCIFDFPDRPTRPVPPTDPGGHPIPDYPYEPHLDWPKTDPTDPTPNPGSDPNPDPPTIVSFADATYFDVTKDPLGPVEVVCDMVLVEHGPSFGTFTVEQTDLIANDAYWYDGTFSPGGVFPNGLIGVVKRETFHVSKHTYILVNWKKMIGFESLIPTLTGTLTFRVSVGLATDLSYYGGPSSFNISRFGTIVASIPISVLESFHQFAGAITQNSTSWAFGSDTILFGKSYSMLFSIPLLQTSSFYTGSVQLIFNYTTATRILLISYP